jgi:hypothetical protein
MTDLEKPKNTQREVLDTQLHQVTLAESQKLKQPKWKTQQSSLKNARIMVKNSLKIAMNYTIHNWKIFCVELENDIDTPIEKYISSQEVLRDLTNGERSRICRDFFTDYHNVAKTYDPSYNLYDKKSQKWLSLKQINQTQVKKSPSNFTKNLLVHVSGHSETVHTRNFVGSVYDLLLIKYSTNPEQFQTILGGYRQRLAFSGNKILTSHYMQAKLSALKSTDTDILIDILALDKKYDTNSHNLYAEITILLTNKLVETLFKTKNSPQIDKMKQKLQNLINIRNQGLDKPKVQNIFDQTIDIFIDRNLQQVTGGYSIEDQEVLTDGIFDSGDNQKLAQFITKLKSSNINNFLD